jgi:hypothetical protein
MLSPLNDILSKYQITQYQITQYQKTQYQITHYQITQHEFKVQAPAVKGTSRLAKDVGNTAAQHVVWGQVPIPPEALVASQAVGASGGPPVCCEACMLMWGKTRSLRQTEQTFMRPTVVTLATLLSACRRPARTTVSCRLRCLST